jgi:hypothetical protein
MGLETRIYWPTDRNVTLTLKCRQWLAVEIVSESAGSQHQLVVDRRG